MEVRQAHLAPRFIICHAATGESIPIEKGPGDPAIGATINKEGLLKVRATRVGADTFLSQVIRLVEHAQGSKVPIQEFADWLTAKFVPAVILISLASFAMWLLFGEQFANTMIVVLLIAVVVTVAILR